MVHIKIYYTYYIIFCKYMKTDDNMNLFILIMLHLKNTCALVA